jgi:hypothetical protein
MKRLDDMTKEELATEALAWDRGDFADGTWKDVTPEATAANERLYYHTGDDGVRRHLITCSCNRDGCTYSRGPSAARVFLAGGPWMTLNALQRDALCQLVWRVPSGEFIVIDPVTEQVIATHTVRASEVPPGSTPGEATEGPSLA